ncbi:cell envelope integrity EipB family protein [Methylobacterium sp. NEAU 140]|uniref:cell envelope integrity EipB family protein n=1 Tax=Methylobacterium sp. NEAU 140 TaxID=3064945 RepID=UPI002734947E|nr:cell envelope integrity EipB family protein [Methylobacterium sp. NEAU 140]MDP4025400.1 cell envelope integrity EipB family protein [Methylobacterium sp. NEAU 140]
MIPYPRARRLAAGLVLLAGTAQAAPTAPAAPEAPAGKEVPAGEGAPEVLANHRAVYDLSLASGGGTRAVESARGRIVIDFRGDACRGYTMQTRQVTELTSAETGARLSDMRSTTFEGGQGREFRFKTTTLTDNKPAAPVDGTATATADALTVKLKGPGKPLSVEGPVLFPSLHMRRLVEAARAGKTTLSAKVYDGSDDGRKVYDTFAVIGHAATGPAPAAGDARDKPLRTGPIAAVPHWPVTLSYFTAGAGERTPIYTLSFDLYENGVSGALKLDYGEFAIRGDMTALDLEADKAAEKGGEKGRGGEAKGCAP